MIMIQLARVKKAGSFYTSKIDLFAEDICVNCVISYERKSWRALNLAIWLHTKHLQILAEFKFGGGLNRVAQNWQVLIIWRNLVSQFKA